MNCPLYDQQKPAVHGLRCTSPVCAPLVDCAGSLTSGNCTVPAFVWRSIVVATVTQPNKSLNAELPSSANSDDTGPTA